jgi:hypothetical protein
MDRRDPTVTSGLAQGYRLLNLIAIWIFLRPDIFQDERFYATTPLALHGLDKERRQQPSDQTAGTNFHSGRLPPYEDDTRSVRGELPPMFRSSHHAP